MDEDFEAMIMRELTAAYLANVEEHSAELLGDLGNWRPTGLLGVLDSLDGARLGTGNVADRTGASGQSDSTSAGSGTAADGNG